MYRLHSYPDGMSNGTGVLQRRNRPQEKTDIEHRRKLVFRWRFVERRTEAEIVTLLARAGIMTTRTTVSRDIAMLRSSFRSYFSERNFDARSEVGIIVAGIEHVIARSFRDSRRSADGKERALHRKVALDAFEKL